VRRTNPRDDGVLPHESTIKSFESLIYIHKSWMEICAVLCKISGEAQDVNYVIS
jgi:hypothetical protein